MKGTGRAAARCIVRRHARTSHPAPCHLLRLRHGLFQSWSYCLSVCAAMRSAFALFRRSVVPRWALALAVVLHVLAGGMPMPAPSSAAISDPVQVALALLNPDICHAPADGQSDNKAPIHSHACLLCPVCLAHGAILVGATPPLPSAPTRLVGRVQPRQPVTVPLAAARETPRARGPPRLSA